MIYRTCGYLLKESETSHSFHQWQFDVLSIPGKQKDGAKIQSFSSLFGRSPNQKGRIGKSRWIARSLLPFCTNIVCIWHELVDFTLCGQSTNWHDLSQNGLKHVARFVWTEHLHTSFSRLCTHVQQCRTWHWLKVCCASRHPCFMRIEWMCVLTSLGLSNLRSSPTRIISITNDSRKSHIRSRFPGCSGQAADAVPACIQVKMEGWKSQILRFPFRPGRLSDETWVTYKIWTSRFMRVCWRIVYHCCRIKLHIKFGQLWRGPCMMETSLLCWLCAHFLVWRTNAWWRSQSSWCMAGPEQCPKMEAQSWVPQQRCTVGHTDGETGRWSEELDRTDAADTNTWGRMSLGTCSSRWNNPWTSRSPKAPRPHRKRGICLSSTSEDVYPESHRPWRS